MCDVVKKEVLCKVGIGYYEIVVGYMIFGELKWLIEKLVFGVECGKVL